MLREAGEEMEQQPDGAIRERDLALAMHETFLGSGSEDALSPRFQNLEIRSSPIGSPRTPRPGSAFAIGRKASSVGAPEQQQQGARLGETGKGKLDDESFVKWLRETEFEHHKHGESRLNNGSFGACPKTVLQQQQEWNRRWLKEPDAFYYEDLELALKESRRRVAALVHSPVEEIVLLDNVTEAASMVAIDVMWGFIEGRYCKGDSILLTNFAYGSVRRAFEAYAVRAGAQIWEVEIPFPVSSSAEIVARFEQSLLAAKAEGKTIRMAVFDHVVSMPSMVLPVKELVALCRKHGVEQVFVDSAQGVGNLAIDVVDIDADYLTGNLHKWMFAPSAVAFFHCKSKHLSRVRHPIVSENVGMGLVSECDWLGTKDYSAKMVVPTALDFFNKVPGGLEAVRAFNHKKVIEVGKMLADAWGTYNGVAPELCASMVMVGLPSGLQIQSRDDTIALMTRLRQEFSIVVHTFTPVSKSQTKSNGVTAHLRISHHIYNTWDEYLRLRDVINALVLEKSKN